MRTGWEGNFITFPSLFDIDNKMNREYLTYRDLKIALEELTEDQLDMTATVFVFDTDEFYPIADTYLSDSDVLDTEEELHPVIEIARIVE